MLVVLTVVTTWATYRFGVFTAIFRQPQPVQLMKSLAVIAGLLFYFASGPGGGGAERACGEVRPHRRGASGL